MPSPSPKEIAHREARRMALVLQEIGGDGMPVAGGWMGCDVPGSWSSFAAGLGVECPVTDADLDALVSFYRQRGRTAQIQITPFQHPALRNGLEARGFAPCDDETVLTHGLDSRPPIDPPSGLTFRPVDASSDADVATFVASQMAGFYADEEAPAGIYPITERVARHARCTFWLLEQDGQVMGSGGLERFEDVAVLIAGCVHPDARRQGLHGTFIHFRLQQAAESGARYATIASVVGGPTERNALRAGFSPVFVQTEFKLP